VIDKEDLADAGVEVEVLDEVKLVGVVLNGLVISDEVEFVDLGPKVPELEPDVSAPPATYTAWPAAPAAPAAHDWPSAQHSAHANPQMVPAHWRFSSKLLPSLDTTLVDVPSTSRLVLTTSPVIHMISMCRSAHASRQGRWYQV